MSSQIYDENYDEIVDGHSKVWMKHQFESIRQSDKKNNYALMYLDIKNFRLFNTLYGYHGANEIIKIIYQSLEKYFENTGWVSHMYADVFLILFQCENKDELGYEWLRDLLDVLYYHPDQRIYRNICISSGVYLLSYRDCSFEEAVEYANISRLGSDTLKNRSSSCEIYDDHFLSDYRRQCELEMKTADAYKNYEFISYLQPKVDTITHEIVEAEALVRWIGTDGNLVPVFEFLPILTKNAYIVLVDLDVFEYICKMLDRRIKEHKKVVPVSFNISKPGFYDPRLVMDYLEILNKYDIPRDLIIFELMESITLDDTEKMKEVIQSFKDEGFRCSLDDFGNGYSSFSVLLNADLDSVKMDRQFFVKNLNGDNKLIIKTVINLIKSLGMKVVAEGVETKEYVDYLAECGCDMIQGFYFHKPMPILEFEALLDKKKD